ncbi:MAG: putative flagellar hook protein [Rhodospirillaceae bacterium]|nr:MAG: putative flagellar hook protein [Rhodospirillaceae bacterium]
MSLWGILTRSANTMMAHSTRLGIISQNVANMNTTSYRRTEGTFKTMLPDSLMAGSIPLFSVNVASSTICDSNVYVITTRSNYDLTINGRAAARPTGCRTGSCLFRLR